MCSEGIFNEISYFVEALQSSTREFSLHVNGRSNFVIMSLKINYEATEVCYVLGNLMKATYEEDKIKLMLRLQRKL